MPLHYAITDALVALVAAWGAWHMHQSHKPAAALGLALFGIAGAIGTVRIVSGMVDELAMIHKAASQLGGIAGASLLMSEIVRTNGWPHRFALSLVAATVAMLVAIAAPLAGAALFAILLVAGAVLLLRRAKQDRASLIGGLGFGLMLVNVLLVRQSPVLGPDWSWHLYHVIVAIWLWCAVTALKARAIR